MKIIKYKRHELRYEPEECIAPLNTFVYDVPYLSACGIFPPLHILNQVLQEGGGDGGMSPGASWSPFSLSSKEYNELWSILSKQDPRSLKEQARFIHVKFKLDVEFDELRDRFTWFKACCDKHRDEYLQHFL